MIWRLVPAILALVVWATVIRADTVHVSGQVREGETYAHRLDRGLMFCLIPEAEYGWQISVAPACDRNAPNFAMIATPPYRGVNPIQLYSWHFLPGAEILPKVRTFQFVLHDRNYRKIMDLLSRRHDAAKVLELASRLGTGRGELRVVRAETASGVAEDRPKLVKLHFSATLKFPVPGGAYQGRAKESGNR